MAEFRVKAHVARQHGFELYSFVMNSRLLREISYVVPRSKDNPVEIQRALDGSRVKDIGKYIREETSVLPNGIVVNLTNDVRVEEAGDGKEALLIFPEGGMTGFVKCAYVLDGQHRIEGFKFADGIEFDLPVVGIHDAPPAIMGKIFTDINSKQKPPSKVHLLAVRYQIGELEVEDSVAMDVVIHLNEDPDSPLQGKIKMRDDDKKTWVTNEGVKSWILPHVGNGGILFNKTPAQQCQILKNYLNACKQLWPEAWGSTDHILTKATGVEIMSSILREVIHRCNLNEGKQTSIAAFKGQMQVLKDNEVELLPDFKVPVDWRSQNFGRFTNKGSKTHIRKLLVNILQAADDSDSE